MLVMTHALDGVQTKNLEIQYKVKKIKIKIKKGIHSFMVEIELGIEYSNAGWQER